MEDVTCLALASSTWRAKTISLLLQDSYLARWLKYEMVYTPPHSWDDLGEDDESDGWYEYHKELCEDAKHCARALKTALAPLAALGIEFEALRMIAGPIENGLYGRQLGCFPCAHTKLGLFFLSYHQTVVQGAVNQLERFSGSGATYLIDSKSASLLGTRVAKLGLAREDVYAIFMTCSYLDLEYHVDDDICTECQENEQVVLEAVTAWASNVDLLAAGWSAKDVAQLCRDMTEMVRPYYAHFMVTVLKPVLNAASNFLQNSLDANRARPHRMLEEEGDSSAPEEVTLESRELLKESHEMLMHIQHAMEKAVDFAVETQAKEVAQCEQATAELTQAIEECETSARHRKVLKKAIRSAKCAPFVDEDLIKRAERLVKRRRSARLAA